MSLPTASTTVHLRAAGRSALNYLNRHLRERNSVVVATQVDVLAVIANHHHGHEVKFISQMLKLADCTVRKSLTRLEHKGLVTSQRSKRDGRRNVYVLTDAGRDALASAGATIELILEPRLRHRLRAFANLRTTLQEIVARIHLQNYEEAYIPDTPAAHAHWAGSPEAEALRIGEELLRRDIEEWRRKWAGRASPHAGDASPPA